MPTPENNSPSLSSSASSAGWKNRGDKVSEYDRWKLTGGMDATILLHSGRVDEAFWLAFKAGWDALRDSSNAAICREGGRPNEK